MSDSLQLPGPIGLVNLGNSCYQNAVLQCLARCKRLVWSLNKEDCVGGVSREFFNLVRLMSTSTEAVKADSLKGMLSTVHEEFGGDRQHDAQEFLLFLLSQLSEEISDRSPQIIEREFCVMEESFIKCCTCQADSRHSLEPTPILSVPLIEDKKSLNLLDCLIRYYHTEVSEYSCTACKTIGVGRQTCEFKRLPSSLIIHLKRFGVVRGNLCKNKRAVQCPFYLNLLSTRYEVQGFICHLGGLYKGHYVAYHKVEDRWYKFDDSIVMPVTKEALRLQIKAAYILFYSAATSSSALTIGDPQELVNNVVSPPSPLFFTTTPPPEGSSSFARTKRFKGEVPNQKKALTPTLLPPSPSLSSPAPSLPPTTGHEVVHPDRSPIKVLRLAGTPPSPPPSPSSDVASDEDEELQIQLLETDGVPGAIIKMEKINDYVVFQLKRWLACRRLRLEGSKAELITRIRNHYKAGQSHILWPGIDEGKWLEMKRRDLLKRMGEEVLEDPPPPVSSAWRPFPGYHIPQFFNRGQVYAYLVESMPKIKYVLGKKVVIQKGRHDTVVPGTEKIHNRAERLLKSSFVQDPEDYQQSLRYYFLKAFIRASMDPKKYFVYVVLSVVSGAVLFAACDECPQSSLGRCSHVGALLLYLRNHVETKGHDPITSTGKARTWALGAVKKDPGPTVRAEYYEHYDTKRRSDFDPRPTAYVTDSMSQQGINNFVRDLQWAVVAEQREHSGENTKVRPQGWQKILPIKYDDFEISPVDTFILACKCQEFYDDLRSIPTTDPFLIPGTEKQRESANWISTRKVLFTASEAKKILGITSGNAQMTFLQSHVWGMNTFEGNNATRYGVEKEDEARRCYELYHQITVDRTSFVESTGLWISKDYPMLGCSPDGIVKSAKKPTKLLEIKCPYILRNADPREFYQVLSKSQLQTFSLRRLTNGEVEMKQTHSHYYQVQMAMDILKISKCDYVVWSPYNLLTVTVSYDEVFWAPKRRRLVEIHQILLAPELWMMRTPRNLVPFQMLILKEEEEDIHG